MDGAGPIREFFSVTLRVSRAGRRGPHPDGGRRASGLRPGLGAHPGGPGTSTVTPRSFSTSGPSSTRDMGTAAAIGMILCAARSARRPWSSRGSPGRGTDDLPGRERTINHAILAVVMVGVLFPLVLGRCCSALSPRSSGALDPGHPSWENFSRRAWNRRPASVRTSDWRLVITGSGAVLGTLHRDPQGVRLRGAGEWSVEKADLPDRAARADAADGSVHRAALYRFQSDRITDS